MAVTIYGIPNCDTMKKARSWLTAEGVGHRFHDYRADGLDRARLTRWVKAVGWEKLLNRSSTTFRALSDTEKTSLNESRAVALMLSQPTVIKRPVLEVDDALLVGFKPEAYEEAFRAR